MKFAKLTGALLFAITMIVARASAQNPDAMMPEASASKAKQILAQMIDAMGGAAYLNVRELQCSGKLSRFGHNNDLTTYLNFKEYWRYPDKYRIDYGKKGNIIDLFSDKEGWTLDHGGVSEEAAENLYEFQMRLLKDPVHLLRYRLKEQGLAYRYAGIDLIDLKPVDLVELVDSYGRIYRIAVQKENHLMVRFTVIMEDPVSHDRSEEITSYANYHPLDGVMTPLQVVRTRDGRRTLQAFYDTCTYNPNLTPNFFSRAGLDQRFSEVGSRTDKKKAATAKDRD